MEIIRESIVGNFKYQLTFDTDINYDEIIDFSHMWDIVITNPKYDIAVGVKSFNGNSHLENLYYHIAVKDNLYPNGLNKLSSRNFNRIKKHIEKKYIVEELYIYDHSCLCIQLSRFDYFDSSFLGFALFEKSKIIEANNVKDYSFIDKEKLTQILISEITTYNEILNGSVYLGLITDLTTNEVDSVGGLIGDFDEIMKELIEAY